MTGAGTIVNSAVVDHATFDISGANAGISIVPLSDTDGVALGAQTPGLTNAAGPYSGIISGNAGLTIGGGTEILTCINTYSGGATINGGTLSVAVDSDLGDSSGGIVLSGGTPEFNANSFASNRGVTSSAAGTVHVNGSASGSWRF